MSSTERRNPSTPRPSPGARRRAALAVLAERQHGTIARRQLVALGFSNAGIARLVAEKHLWRVVHGVYAVGHPTLTRHGWWMVAALAGGEDSVLSHRAAAAIYGLLRGVSVIDVIVTAKRGVELPHFRAHRCTLDPVDRVSHHGVPVTSVARTLLDLAGSEGPTRLAEALDSSLMLRLYDHREMLAVMERYPGRRGISALRAALARLGDEPHHFRSGSERQARDLIMAADLPEPEVNAWLPTVAEHGHELDLYWRSSRRNLEIDGPRHDQPWQRSKDRLRDTDLRDRGVTVKRVRVSALDRDPARFVADVTRFLAGD